MTKKSTKRNLRIFVFLMFLLPLGAFAQTSTTYYVCGVNSATLTPDFQGYVPVAGDNVIWKDGATTVETIVFPNAGGGKYVTPTNLPEGAHAYTVQVIPADVTLCPGDVSSIINIYKLPAPVVTAASSVSTACVDLATRPVVSVALSSPAPPSGVTIAYNWIVTLDGVTKTLADIADQTGNSLTLKSGIATGTYVFSVEASYNVGTGAQILPTANCKDTKTVTVILTPKPGKPTITVG